MGRRGQATWILFSLHPSQSLCPEQVHMIVIKAKHSSVFVLNLSKNKKTVNWQDRTKAGGEI